MTIGEKIRQRRIDLGMTQEDLAFKLGYKSRSSVNKVELASDLTLKTIRMYAKALNMDVNTLMGWENSRFAHVDTGAVADLMLDPTNKDLIDLINRMDPSQKEELRDYATFLLNKKRG